LDVNEAEKIASEFIKNKTRAKMVKVRGVQPDTQTSDTIVTGLLEDGEGVKQNFEVRLDEKDRSIKAYKYAHDLKEHYS
jgi:hypothetical protein